MTEQHSSSTENVRERQGAQAQPDTPDRFELSEAMQALYNRIMRCGSQSDCEHLKQINPQEQSS